MAVTLEDVGRIAQLARLGLAPERARALVAELNAILDHMEVLGRADTTGVQEVDGVGAAGMPLRSDAGPPLALHRSPDAFAPDWRGGFFLVPRLATHETPEAE